MNFIKNLAIALLLTGSLFSCSKDDDTSVKPALDGLTRLAEGYAIGAATKVEIWGVKNFYHGYNQLAVVAYDSLDLSRVITDAAISFAPVMTMTMSGMTYTHSAPVENPKTEAIDGIFSGAVAFIMPTSASGSWALGLQFTDNKTGKSGTATFAITVDTPDETVMKSFVATTSDASKLFVSLVQPTAPEVGINNFELTIHKMESKTSFPAQDGYSVSIEPEMPSMGHGSPNNVNPVSTGNGHYAGKVNFTMTGEWRINVAITQNGETVTDNLYFDITL